MGLATQETRRIHLRNLGDLSGPTGDHIFRLKVKALWAPGMARWDKGARRSGDGRSLIQVGRLVRGMALRERPCDTCRDVAQGRMSGDGVRIGREDPKVEGQILSHKNM